VLPESVAWHPHGRDAELGPGPGRVRARSWCFSGATRMQTEVLPTSVFLELSVGNLNAAVGRVAADGGRGGLLCW